MPEFGGKLRGAFGAAEQAQAGDVCFCGLDGRRQFEIAGPQFFTFRNQQRIDEIGEDVPDALRAEECEFHRRTFRGERVVGGPVGMAQAFEMRGERLLMKGGGLKETANGLPVNGDLPQCRDAALRVIDRACAGERPLDRACGCTGREFGAILPPALPEAAQPCPRSVVAVVGLPSVQKPGDAVEQGLGIAGALLQEAQRQALGEHAHG